ncbi:MAG: single-stranded DNA-binding protein [Methylophaga sp.]|uniref:single-stranded DNA-binding protein n=1 Tax=Methylophaga sp. TaxID=2024840 RepID=UPI00299DC26E|nr:single-stranded DNA-binding protein [Methylophaga sp.]MDX1751475.1 single-stranded DNA-binding protein [Methylophaga sp.]
MKIEILSQEIRTQSGTSKRTGNPYAIRKQTGFAHFDGEPYPVKMELNLPDGAIPYAPGNYTLDEKSFYVDRYGSLAVSGELKLKPAAQGSLSKVG